MFKICAKMSFKNKPCLVLEPPSGNAVSREPVTDQVLDPVFGDHVVVADLADHSAATMELFCVLLNLLSGEEVWAFLTDGANVLGLVSGKFERLDALSYGPDL